MRPASSCPVCEREARPLHHVRDVPVSQNSRCVSEAAARAVARGELALWRCGSCGLTYNAAFDAALVRYDAGYQIDQSGSARFRRHLDDVCRRVAGEVDGPLDVVEVGCGQGAFLSHLAERLGPRLRSAVGFDPAARASQRPEPVRLIARVLDAGEAARLPRAPNLVMLRHTIEHVARPVELLASIRAAFSGELAIFVETPDVDHSLSRGLAHDFYYEHCSLHTAAALRVALGRAGFSGTVVERVFGGEYLLARAHTAGALDYHERAAPRCAPDFAAEPDFAADFAAFAPRWTARLERARARGGVALWGGAGKGATFALLVDPARALIDAVVDIDPDKQGTFVAGTGHRIVSPGEARALGVATLVVMNENYAEEIAAFCRETRWPAEVLCDSDRA